MELGAHNFHEAPERHLITLNGARERHAISKRFKPHQRVVFETVHMMGLDFQRDAEPAA